jgi:hypothetical protein
MKNKYKTLLTLLLFFLSNAMLFAQTSPGSTDDTSTLESTDTPAAPIDSNLNWLVILGTLYVGYYFYTRRNKTVKTD